jgi:hypothetical protein
MAVATAGDKMSAISRGTIKGPARVLAFWVLSLSLMLFGGGSLLGCSATNEEEATPASTSEGLVAGVIRVSANGRYLVDGAGEPFLPWGEAAWTLNSQLGVTGQNNYLDTRASQGINAIALMVISRYQDNAPNDAEGVAPFTTPGDFATFNPVYFAKAADVVARARDRGMVVFLAPLWAGYDADQGFYNTMVSNGATKVQAYGAAVANVFKDFDNIVWVIGGDKTPPIPTQLFNALTAGIRSVDNRHLVTAHWNFAPSDQPSGDWDDITSAYDWAGGVQYTQIRSEYEENDAPVVLLEALYELNSSYGATTKILRFQSIMAMLAGAKGSFFGHEGVWHLGASRNLAPQSQGHPYDLNSVGMRHQTNVRAFFIAMPWYDLVPDFGSGFVTAGRGSFGSAGYVGAAKTSSGRHGVVYIPNGGQISVNTGALTLPVAARWFDPTNGTYRAIATYSAAATVQLTTPGNNSAGEADWLLVFDGSTGPINNPPTVATAASATPNPTASTTATLSVLGSDDGGETNLVYSWATTGTPPAPVSFSRNGNNASKSTVATFARAGSYSLRVTISDAQGQTVSSTVSVSVSQTLTAVAVSPATATVVPNGTQQFTAIANDQFGMALTTQPSFTWTTSGGGSINASGLFSAGASSGGPFTVTATSGARQGTAAVTVSNAVVTAIHRINCGGSATGGFTADQFFSGGNTFSTSSNVVTSGVTNAAPAAVYQSERFGNHTYTVGGLTAGAAYTVRLHFAEVYFTAAGARVFNVAVNGTQVLTNFDIFAVGGANKAVVRDFPVSASAGGQIVIQYTTVVENPKSSAIEILTAGGTNPNQAPTVATAASANPSPATGTSANLSVNGADDGGQAALTYTWATTGTPPAPVTFSANGTNAAKNTTATFSRVGNYNLRATIADAQGLSVTSAVALTVNPTFTSIAVTPAAATVAPNSTQQFAATARDQFGVALTTAPGFTWTASGGGTINGTGLFTSSATPGGPFTVTATSGARSGSASVTVSTAPTVPIYRINAGGGAVGSFSADQFFSGGNEYSTGTAVVTSGVANAAPAALYQTERFGNHAYTLGSLSAGASYTVRLHFAEIWATAAGVRIFNVSINGVQVLTNFDIYATAGPNKAVVRDFAATANASGQIVVQYSTVVENPKSSGIEIF